MSAEDRRRGPAAVALALILALASAACFAQPLHAAEASCAEPAAMDDGWERADPATSGFDAEALCAVLRDAAKMDANLHAVVVERHGRLVAELYRRGRDRPMSSLFAREVEFGPTVLHDMRSVSKSVVGLLVGIAIDERRIAGVATPVLDFYPRDEDLRTPERASITIEHLLTMASGLAWVEEVTTYGTAANDETHLPWAWNPHRYVLDRAMAARPGERFNYSGGDNTLLADILARATGRDLRELARSELFTPLGIEDWEWRADLFGRPIAFAGLRLRPRDLAKIGRMMLDHGRWRGRQVVPAEWVAASLAAHIATGDDGRQYGYQWWIGRAELRGKPVEWSAAIGNGGQRLFMLPALDLAVVFTAGEYNSAAIGRELNRLLSRIMATVRD
ncbi:MAG: serine hydrolase domain-containing protein [Usitatibacter sp.]